LRTTYPHSEGHSWTDLLSRCPHAKGCACRVAIASLEANAPCGALIPFFPLANISWARAQKLRSRITAAQNIRITGAVRSNFALKIRSPGTEFLDAETGRQKSQPKSVNVGRDQNPGRERPEIRAERPYLESSRKWAVCGDWMVVCAVRYEPVSTGDSLLTG
jgi:hypothetical protein